MKYEIINSDLNDQFQSHSLDILSVIFQNRGISSQEIPHYLSNLTENDTYPDTLLDNLTNAAQIIISHIKNEDAMFIQVDCDADGYCSAALFINYLYKLFPTYTTNKIIYALHKNKVHGLELDKIPENIKLVVIPDASSNEYEKHKQLQKQGIDVVILDHHEADQVSPYACVVNNQLCDYPNKALCGAAIVYKLCHYIDSKLQQHIAEELMDLVAVALVADMMSLTAIETVYYIRQGLQNIMNPFLVKMVEAQEFSITKHGQLDPFSVGFYIAPLINAVTRMGTPEEQFLIFESMLDFKGNEEIPSKKRGAAGELVTRAEEAVRVARNVKSHQDTERDAKLEEIKKIIEAQELPQKNKILIVQLEKTMDFNNNLTGLIANQLRAIYQQPIMLLHPVEREDGNIEWMGSARGYEYSPIRDFKKFLSDSNLVDGAEGHPNAFGVWLQSDNIDKLNSYANDYLSNITTEPIYRVDICFKGDNWDGGSIIEVAQNNDKWGKDLDEPYIAINHLPITPSSIQLLSKDKHPTIKITLSNGVSIMKFKSSEEEFNQLYSSCEIKYITLVGKCNKNEYYNKITPQIFIEDYEIEPEIEYYF